MQGESLGPYLIDRELGAGGMGKVYAAIADESARAVAPGVRVALKVVHRHLLETPGFFKRFLREAEIGKTVRHPNVVRTLDCDSVVVDGQRCDFLAMEYVEGQTLRDLLVEMETVPEELCRHIGREVCKGLAAIHAAGVVHRDMKPENVLITGDQVVKVMDLGVARLMDEAVRLSQTGAFVGSLQYAAPEQFTPDVDGDGGLDGRADLHALGLMLYELSTGQHPFLGDSVPEIIHRVLRTEPRKVGQIHPQLSAFFEEVVDTLLQKKREDRFADAAALLGALDAGEDSDWWRARARTIQATTKRPIRRVRIPRETAVYGREKEIAKLRGLFEQAKSGDGRVVLLEGEAGIGKSRLVDELISRLQQDGEDINFLFGSYPPGGAASAAGAFSTAFREQFGEGGAASYLPQTPLLVPAFAAVLRGDAAPSGVEPLTKDSLVTCFVQAARVLGAERPTVILIDDLHFAPEEARSLFSALALALPGHRVFLVGTTRPGVEGDWRGNLGRFEYVTLIQVERLFPKDLIELLRDSLKSADLASALSAQIAIKSDGNPFFAFEIIRGLREGQFITQRDDGTWVSTRIIDDIQIPSSVLDLVNARVAGLSEDERALLDVAACWGYEFDPGLVGEVLGLARIPALRSFGQVERLHRLVRSSGRHYVFDHHQVQEALYGSLNEQLREEYHGALAETLETRSEAVEQDPETLDGALCVDLCEHYLRGARGGDAVRYLKAAQEHLTTGYLHAQVVALTERALAVPALLAGLERAKTLLRLVAALNSLGRRAREEECAHEAERLAEEAQDEEVRGEAVRLLAQVFYNTSRHEEAEAAALRLLDLARARGDRQSEARATAGLGAISVAAGRPSEARERYERSLALSREIGYRQGEATAIYGLGTLFLSVRRWRESQEHFERSLALCREVGDRVKEAGATVNLGCIFHSLGRWREAQEHLERGLAMCREIGHRQFESNAVGSLGTLFHSLGRWRESQEHYERRLALAREMGDRTGEAGGTVNLGILFLSVGRDREAREHLERGLAMCREIGHRQFEAIAAGSLGTLFAALGRLAEAQEHDERSLALSREMGDRRGEARAAARLGSLFASRGRLAAAQESLAAARDLAVEIGIPGTETLSRCELALLPGGDAADALAAFAEHEEQLEAGERRSARFLLWKATGDRTHLDAAKRLLDEQMTDYDEETRQRVVTVLRGPREIMAAWSGEGGAGTPDDPDDDEPRGTESITRVG